MKVSNVNVYGLEESIKGAKYPMSVDIDSLNSELTNGIKKLAQSTAGEGHDQWLTGVTVQFDLRCSNKMWVEAERYRFLYFVSSQSTMHRIAKFDLASQCNKYVDSDIINIVQAKIDAYNNLLKDFPDSMDDMKRKKYLEILYNIPAGFEITARMTTNYRQLKTIYQQRKTHRLPEWREFCKWIETLPHSELIIGEKNDL